MGDMMKKPFDWSADVAKLTMPVLLVYGDSDIYHPEHVMKFYQSLGGGSRMLVGGVSTCQATASLSCLA